MSWRDDRDDECPSRSSAIGMSERVRGLDRRADDDERTTPEVAGPVVQAGNALTTRNLTNAPRCTREA